MVMLLFGLVLSQAEKVFSAIIRFTSPSSFLSMPFWRFRFHLIYGFTGLFSLGHAGFIAIGAYVSALCILTPEQKEMM